MKKSLPQVAFCAAVLALCVAPAIGMVVLPPAAAGANQHLSAKPILLQNGSVRADYLNQLTAYAGDHFAFRQNLITAQNALYTTVFHTAAAEDVIFGTDGMLYYAKTLDDYQNRLTMTARDSFAAAYNLRLMQEFCEGQGAAFIFTIAPNKNTLYPADMPTRYQSVGTAGNYEQLLPAMTEAGVRYVDLFSALGGEDTLLYHRQDTHWTAAGAAKACDTILSALGRTDAPRYDGAAEAAQAAGGDLYAMLYPTAAPTARPDPYPHTFAYETTPQSEEDILMKTTSDTGQGHLLFCRDSFGNALHPFLADAFATAVITRETPYPIDQVQAGDTVVIELAQRNISNLLRYAPRMAAPVCALPETVREGGTATVQEEQNGAYYRISGTLVGTVDLDSPVLVTADGVTYAAFLQQENRFALWLTTSPQSVCVTYYQDGAAVQTAPTPLNF